MSHVEVPRLVAAAGRINDKLDSVLSENHSIYAKTKKQYKELAIQLLSSVEKIATILQCDSLDDSDDGEFESSSIDISDISEALDQASEKVDKVSSFVSPSDSSANKNTIHEYGRVLQKAADTDLACVDANTCANVLNTWFKARFSNKDNSFKYNISYIPSWITDIILLYGKYHSDGRTSEFVDMMYTWCSDIQDHGSRYAVPYQVYQIGKSDDPNDYTMDAVLIGDILMDKSLYDLTEYSSPNLVAHLSYYPVADVAKVRNPEISDEIFVRLMNRDSLLIKYNIS